MGWATSRASALAEMVYMEVVGVVVRDRDGDRSGARASNTRPGHGRRGAPNTGSTAAGREPSLPAGALVK
ncbi:hypothetical protein [Streptomyces canus]|uniref:hypothetical protein n=1 Tax=Streptomyces canus TaxID=58343 RepID=UPI002785DC05|nr:hypothetical protein [Streptomyces canus]MDQ1066660.1 hypothetical protein [Streptomyces canus]